MNIRRDEYNQIQKRLVAFYAKDKESLVKFCLSKGISVKEIADVLEVSTNAIRQRYIKR